MTVFAFRCFDDVFGYDAGSRIVLLAHNVLQLFRQFALGMLVLEMLLVCFRVGHLCLNDKEKEIYIYKLRRETTQYYDTLQMWHAWTSAFCAAFFCSVAL